MKRIAVCFYGHLGGFGYKDNLGGIIPPNITFDSFKRNIINNSSDYVFDTFVHSWSHLSKNEIVSTLNPISYEIQEQKNFWKEAVSDHKKMFDLRDLRSLVSLSFKRWLDPVKFGEINYQQLINTARVYSRWYSTKRVIELKRMYEVNCGFSYDLVFLTRFDISWKKNINLDVFEGGHFYSSGWNVKNYHNQKISYDKRNLQDYWFIAESKMMDIFSTLYDFLPRYYPCSHRASFQHAQKLFGESRMKYVYTLGEDYELTRRVLKTEFKI